MIKYKLTTQDLMTNPLYTSLKTSKLIASKMPEFVPESDEHNYCLGHTWYDDNPDGEFVKCDETKPVLSYDHYCESASLTTDNALPALTTHDCLRFIREYLDPTGWSDLYAAEKAHEFLSALLADNLDLSGKHVDAFFSELLKSS